jgi:hypothetical protein
MVQRAKTAIDAGKGAPVPRPHPPGLRLEPVANGSFLSRAEREPARRLMLGVLADAIATFRRMAGTATREEALAFVETAQWFASDEADEPFAFVAICRTLGSDAAYLRLGLRNVRARARAAWPALLLH